MKRKLVQGSKCLYDKQNNFPLTSTSFMTATGLKKCRPPKRSSRPVAAAMSLMGSEEVLLAKMVCLKI